MVTLAKPKTPVRYASPTSYDEPQYPITAHSTASLWFIDQLFRDRLGYPFDPEKEGFEICMSCLNNYFRPVRRQIEIKEQRLEGEPYLLFYGDTADHLGYHVETVKAPTDELAEVEARKFKKKKDAEMTFPRGLTIHIYLSCPGSQRTVSQDLIVHCKKCGKDHNVESEISRTMPD